MRLLRHLLSSTLAILFILSPNSYGQGSVRPSRSEEALRLAVETVRSFQSFSDLVTDLKLKSPETAEKFSKYLKLNGIYGAKIPRLAIVGNSVVMGTNNEIAITLTEDDKFKVSWHKNHRIISPDMTFEEQIVAIESLIPKKTSFIIDLIIPNAYAHPGVLVLAGAFLFVVSYFGNKSERRSMDIAHAAKMKQTAEISKSVCENSAGSSIEELIEHHSRLTELMWYCDKGISEFEEVCKLINSTLSCFTTKILAARTTINGDRNSGKEIILNPNTRRFSVEGKKAGGATRQ
jgi:hypothetical protein